MQQHAASTQVVGSIIASADPRPRIAAPTSQVTLLFTDIEGSTALWEEDEVRMAARPRGAETILAVGVTAW